MLLYEFYRPLLDSLSHISFTGSAGYSVVVMHGMTEDELPVVHDLLAGLTP